MPSKAHFLSLVSAVLSALMLLSCSHGTRYFVYNNIGDAVTLEIGGIEHEIRTGHQEQVRLDAWTKDSPTVRVKTGHRTYSYELKFKMYGELEINGQWVKLDTSSYVHTGNVFTLDFVIQLDSGGLFRIVPGRFDPPISAGVEQPNGFPIAPKAVENASNL